MVCTPVVAYPITPQFAKDVLELLGVAALRGLNEKRLRKAVVDGLALERASR